MTTTTIRTPRNAIVPGPYVIKAVADGLLQAMTEAGFDDPQWESAGPLVSERENQVLRLMAHGHSNKEIAATLGISVKTVEVHKANAMRKLGFRGRTDVVQYALLQGWLRED